MTYYPNLNCPFHPSLNLLFCHYLLVKITLKCLFWKLHFYFVIFFMFIKNTRGVQVHFDTLFFHLFTKNNEKSHNFDLNLIIMFYIS